MMSNKVETFHLNFISIFHLYLLALHFKLFSRLYFTNKLLIMFINSIWPHVFEPFLKYKAQMTDWIKNCNKCRVFKKERWGRAVGIEHLNVRNIPILKNFDSVSSLKNLATIDTLTKKSLFQKSYRGIRCLSPFFCFSPWSPCPPKDVFDFKTATNKKKNTLLICSCVCVAIVYSFVYEEIVTLKFYIYFAAVLCL